MEDDKEQVENNQRKKAKSKSIVGYILFLLFGLGTWLNLNGIWIQLPLLIPLLSEKWSLSPQLGMASNIANVGPLIIVLIRYLIGESSSYEVPSICVIFSVGIVVPLILSFTWSKQVVFLGKPRSMYLLILGFFLALVNCTSSVTYLPFVNRFDKKWLNIYFTGESLSSLIPAMLGLIQGVGQKAKCVPDPENLGILKEEHYPPRFSVQIYLVCLSIIMFISFMAFLLLWRNQRKEKKNSEIEQIPVEENAQNTLLTVNTDSNLGEKKDKVEEKFNSETKIYLFVTLWTSILLIGCIPSINSYSLNPYGAATFHYVLISCQCCYTFLSLIAIFAPKLFQVTMPRILILTIVGTVAFIYIFLTALMSPCSPFVDSDIGSYLIGFVWLIVYLLFYYERIALGNYFNQTSGHRGLFWYGFLTQVGAFTGAIFIFTLTCFDVFKERELCQDYPLYEDRMNSSDMKEEEELNSVSYLSSGSNSIDNVWFNSNVVQCLNEEVHSVIQLIKIHEENSREDHLVSRRSIFQLFLPRSKMSFENRNDFNPKEGSLLNSIQWKKLFSWNVKSSNDQWNLVYKGSRDGFHAKDFHRLCDNKGPTITIIRSRHGRLFGGYTRISWHSDKSHFSTDPDAFLFSFSSKCSIKYCLIDRNSQYAIWNAPNYGPTFGRGADLFICSNSDLIGESYSRLPSSYRDPTGLAKKALAGEEQFFLEDIEIYH